VPRFAITQDGRMHVVGADADATLCGIESPQAIVATFQGDTADFQRDRERCLQCLLRLDSPSLGARRFA
jgi:hypothetical protein